MVDLAADLGDRFVQTGKFDGKAATHVVSGKVILRLVFRAVEIVADGFELFECDIDCAVLAAYQEQRTLALLEIFLNCGPA